MGTAVGVCLYLALAAIFYARLTATATDGMSLPNTRPAHWHRVRRRVKEFVRRVRPASHKH